MMAGGFYGFASFAPHIAVFLGLIAFGFGFWICQQAKASPHCPKLGKFIGGLIALVSLLGLLCIGYLTIKKCCHSQYGEDWHQKHMQMMMQPETPEKEKN